MDAIVLESPAVPASAPTLAASGTGTSTLMYVSVALLIAVLGANVLVILSHTTEFAATALGQAVRRIVSDIASPFGWVAPPAAKEGPVDRAPVKNPTESAQPRVLPVTGSAGWCYVGQQRGLRSCIKVGDNDYCESGSIFPSEDICVNPSLRP